MRAPCGFPRQNPGLNFPALPASDHTPLVPPGELARQASLGAEPALSPLISRSVSRWIYHWVIKAINKSLIVGWARPGTHAPCIVLSSKRAHTAPETMPYFLPGSCRPKPASWARPRALAKPLSWSPMDLAIPMTRVVASSLRSKRTGGQVAVAGTKSCHSPWMLLPNLQASFWSGVRSSWQCRVHVPASPWNMDAKQNLETKQERSPDQAS